MANTSAPTRLFNKIVLAKSLKKKKKKREERYLYHISWVTISIASASLDPYVQTKFMSKREPSKQCTFPTIRLIWETFTSWTKCIQQVSFILSWLYTSRCGSDKYHKNKWYRGSNGFVHLTQQCKSQWWHADSCPFLSRCQLQVTRAPHLDGTSMTADTRN